MTSAPSRVTYCPTFTSTPPEVSHGRWNRACASTMSNWLRSLIDWSNSPRKCVYRASEPYIAWNLKPKSYPVAFGSRGRCTVSDAWFKKAELALSVKSWPKFVTAGLFALPEAPTSTRPVIDNVSHQEGIGGFALTAFRGISAALAAVTAANAITVDVMILFIMRPATE